MGQRSTKGESHRIKVTKMGTKMMTYMVDIYCGGKTRKPQNMGKNSL